ncbi:ABC transporter permease [Aggregatilinea lenta]|uniref:ABC transporter permease n=1 Tax=Aggregatilinea lenta TaxID=913108 RepID=UPI000E5A932F|nr:ABC transporter permease [Aggregatilinea lenta]
MTTASATTTRKTFKRPSILERLVDANGRWRVWINLGLLAAILLLGLLAPLLPLQNPVKPNPMNTMQPPSAEHYFGTDRDGMDIFARTIYAIRTDFTLALSSVLIGIAIGVPLGAIAGYCGGLLDNVITRVTEVFQGFPQILFGMAVIAAAGNTLTNVVLIVAFYNIPVYSKMVRSVVIPLRDVDFVQAAKVAGNPSSAIIFRHIIPNALVPVFSQLPLSCAYAVQMIAGLSFIGLGVEIPKPEWGSMIQIGANYIVFGKWWLSIFPGAALFLSVWILNNISDILKTLWIRRV